MQVRLATRHWLLVLASFALPAAASPPSPVGLSGFAPGWRLVATQGADEEDPGGNTAPGKLHLCITRDGGKTCRPALDDLLTRPGQPSAFDEAHYLEAARIVRRRADRALLWVQVASVHGGNGDQWVGRMALSYDRATDRFVPVFASRRGATTIRRCGSSCKARCAARSSLPCRPPTRRLVTGSP